MPVTVTDEMTEAAAKMYGPEDAEFLAAMDELQQCPLDPEAITEEEKKILLIVYRHKPGIKELDSSWKFIADNYEYRIYDVLVR